MELTSTARLALISCVYLSLFTLAASRRRCGSYRQACAGGNGKRSMPMYPPSSSGTHVDSGVLRKLLLGDLDSLNGGTRSDELASRFRSSEYPASAYDEESREDEDLGKSEQEEEMAASDMGPEETSGRAIREMAIAELMLRKYTSAVERLLRKRESRLA